MRRRTSQLTSVSVSLPYRKWNLPDYGTVTARLHRRLIDLFNEVGILTSVANNRTTIHTIHCLAFWFVDGRDAPIRNPHYHLNPVTPQLAVQGNANPMSANGNGNSHPLSFTSSNPVPSVADANNDEREENKLSPYGEDGQLPEGYLEQLDEHYANLLPKADEPYRTSNDVALGDTPAMPNNPLEITKVINLAKLSCPCVAFLLHSGQLRFEFSNVFLSFIQALLK